MEASEIIALLPYQKPFLFVDSINDLSEKGIVGHYTFKEDEIFYEGHFKDNPITPGVILTECMAQIGLVCLGIYLLKDELETISDVSNVNIAGVEEKELSIKVNPYELDARNLSFNDIENLQKSNGACG